MSDPPNNATLQVDQRTIDGAVGGSVFDLLSRHAIIIPSSCGGRGICHRCRIVVGKSEAVPQPTEVEQLALDSAELAGGVRLACQLPVTDGLQIETRKIPPKRSAGLFGKWL